MTGVQTCALPIFQDDPDPVGGVAFEEDELILRVSPCPRVQADEQGGQLMAGDAREERVMLKGEIAAIHGLPPFRSPDSPESELDFQQNYTTAAIEGEGWT